MARRFVEAQHPRHKENGRFREKHGSDATAYAKRISAKIGASRGEGGGDKPARRRPPAKKAPAARVEARPDRKAVKGEHEKAYDKAISEGDHSAAMRAAQAAHPGMSDEQKATTRKHIEQAIERKPGGPGVTTADLARAKKAARANGAETRAEIDANLHKRYKDASVAELRAMIKALAVEHKERKSGSMHNQAVADSLARLIEKQT